MLRSINSPLNHHDDYLRNLFDQRNAQADPQGRFSTDSRFTDTPSIYSHPFFSPRPLGQESPSPATQLPPNSPNISTWTGRKNRDRPDDHGVSMLDLSDEPRLSVASDIHPNERQVDEDTDTTSRMSYLGPKMRFHSRAPWEIEEEVLQEADDEDPVPSSKKGFSFSSPRPSGESSRSKMKSKRSFETTSSNMSYPQGALYALAQESLSTSSLAVATTSQKLRAKFSLNVRSESPHSMPPSPAADSYPSHVAPSDIPSRNDHIANTFSHHQPAYGADDFHPYANPDLTISFAPVSPTQSVSRSDSIATDSMTSISTTRSESTSTLAPVTSISSTSPKIRTSTLEGKEISLPITAVNNTHRFDFNRRLKENRLAIPPPGIDKLPGWTERGSQPFSLISLEEARAQRTLSAHPTNTSTSAGVSFPDVYDSENRGATIDRGLPQRVRVRTISTGTKAKSALHHIVGGQQRSEPDSMPAKALKHKKSGFMRLFNSGRGQERDERASPPPVPPLIEAQTVYKVPGIAHRVPVPNISPSLLGASTYLEDTPTLQPSAFLKPAPSSKRTVPHLSINTHPEGYTDRAPASAIDESFQMRMTTSDTPHKPWLNNTRSPQSAPANVSEFPALKLRPVSTIFSAQFGDLTQDSQPSLETDIDTSTNVFSPVTPGSGSRHGSDPSSSDNKPTIMTTISEDQCSILKALQDEMLNAKKAWQRQIWELEGQVRDLKTEIEDLRKAGSGADYCQTCGRGAPPVAQGRQGIEGQETKCSNVMDRPRARTGSSSRFGTGM
ncbi:hypothetical protein H0H81_005525 [Sphagnurus paluster]|uniref:Uncharacterized protein n=1 Tax=Sphagnurus paluster TaxID=117069 RepID=A0A9P7KJ61_9AGAR|nr:hypothetical protein H0H81_005525 [Sphagnurus paluster]